MRRLISALLFLSLPAGVLADGIVLQPLAVPTEVRIPDQRALIHFTNGIERLVIETRFTAAGSDFAWVVPLPSQPVVEPATTGMFPTLHHLFQPRLTHAVPRYYIAIILGCLCLALFRRLSRRSVWDAFAVAIVIMVIAAALLPGLATSKSMTAVESETASDVSMLERRVVGDYETTTISSSDPGALQDWLRENGFAVPAGADQVFADYVREGWVFVATKLRRVSPELATSTPHPLSFTFKTERPVYPMRLTGLGKGPLRVELYVFGPGRAEAPHFNVVRCTQPVYSKSAPEDHWARSTPEIPRIVHPLLHRWLEGSPVATKLTASLSSADMGRDVWLQWAPFEEKQDRRFSTFGATVIALNWGVGSLAVVLLGLIVFFFVNDHLKPRRRRVIAAAIMICAALTWATYTSLPKTEVRLSRLRSSTQNDLDGLYLAVTDANAAGLPQLREEARHILEADGRNRHDTPLAYFMAKLQNPWLGGRVHEEDSPGNYVLRPNPRYRRVEFVGFDAEGAAHVLGDCGPL